MPTYLTTLSHVVSHLKFSAFEQEFKKSISCLQGIAKKVRYLHRQKLCYLDIKLSNILVNDIDKPVLSDIGSLMYTDTGTDNYVSPFIFRPPEAHIKDGNRVVVDGFKYDLYTQGLLAIELFTKRSVNLL